MQNFHKLVDALTADETVALFEVVVAALPDDALNEALNRLLTNDQKAEYASKWDEA